MFCFWEHTKDFDLLIRVFMLISRHFLEILKAFFFAKCRQKCRFFFHLEWESSMRWESSVYTNLLNSHIEDVLWTLICWIMYFSSYWGILEYWHWFGNPISSPNVVTNVAKYGQICRHCFTWHQISILTLIILKSIFKPKVANAANISLYINKFCEIFRSLRHRSLSVV